MYNFDFIKSQHGNIYPSCRWYLIIFEVFSLHHVSLILMASEGGRRRSITTLVIYIREFTCGRRQGQRFLPLNPVSSTLYCVDGSVKKTQTTQNFKKVILDLKLS